MAETPAGSLCAPTRTRSTGSSLADEIETSTLLASTRFTVRFIAEAVSASIPKCVTGALQYAVASGPSGSVSVCAPTPSHTSSALTSQ